MKKSELIAEINEKVKRIYHRIMDLQDQLKVAKSNNTLLYSGESQDNIITLSCELHAERRAFCLYRNFILDLEDLD